MLNDFSWNMTGYIPKHQVNPHGDGIIPYVAERIFQLEPEPPAVDSLNEYILSALREKNLLYFSFFLHHYETQLNKRIKGFLSVDGGNLYDTDRFIDIKISCREQMPPLPASKILPPRATATAMRRAASATLPPWTAKKSRRSFAPSSACWEIICRALSIRRSFEPHGYKHR